MEMVNTLWKNGLLTDDEAMLMQAAGTVPADEHRASTLRRERERTHHQHFLSPSPSTLVLG